MQLPRLEIHHTFAELGFTTKQARIEIRQPHGELSIRQPHAQMKMTKTGGNLTIDQSEAFADANVKHIFRLNKEWVDKAKRKALQSLAEVAAEGNRLMKIENYPKTTIIPQIAREKSNPPPKDVNIDWIPSSLDKVKFHYEPAKIHIHVQEGKVSIKGKPRQPEITYHRGDFQIYLKQKAQMNIQVVQESINKII